jgi:hypothetical protein
MKSTKAAISPRRQKELFDPMSTRSPIPINGNATWESVLRTRPLALSLNSSWRQLFRPYTFGIIGLAVAVFLWGYGYKLSLYHCHSGSSTHTPVAKLWIEPRSAPIAATSSLKAKSHFVARSQAAVATVQRLPSMCRAFACILPLRERRAVLFDLLVPSRAPPPLCFRLA